MKGLNHTKYILWAQENKLEIDNKISKKFPNILKLNNTSKEFIGER